MGEILNDLSVMLAWFNETLERYEDEAFPRIIKDQQVDGNYFAFLEMRILVYTATDEFCRALNEGDRFDCPEAKAEREIKASPDE